MKITVQQGEIQKENADALIVNLFFGAQPGGASGAIDQALDGQISTAINLGDFKGEANETLLLYTQGRIEAPRVLVVGLGHQQDFDLEGVRRAAGTAIATLIRSGARNAATILHGTGMGKLSVEASAQAVAEASILAAYRFDAYRPKNRSLPL